MATITASQMGLSNAQNVAVDDYTERSVASDMFRRRYPKQGVLLSIVAPGTPGLDTNVIRTKKLISKKRVFRRHHQVPNYTPLAVDFTANGVIAAGAEATKVALTVVSSTGMIPRLGIVNTENGDTARIDAVTNATTVQIVPFGGTFTCAVNDRLLLLAPLYEEGSENPYVLQKDFDMVSFYLSIFRYAVGISNSQKGDKAYLPGGQVWPHIKKDGLLTLARLAEYALLASRKVTSGEKTTPTNSPALTEAFSHGDGLLNLAQYPVDMGGNMQYTDFTTRMWEESSDVIDSSEEMILLGGRRTKGKLLDFGRDKLVENDSGEKSIFGFHTEVYRTDMNNVRFVHEEFFDHGGYKDQALLFNPKDVAYCYKEGRDFMQDEKIQLPSKDGQIDGLIAEVGIAHWVGGETMSHLINI